MYRNIFKFIWKALGSWLEKNTFYCISLFLRIIISYCLYLTVLVRRQAGAAADQLLEWSAVRVVKTLKPHAVKLAPLPAYGSACTNRCWSQAQLQLRKVVSRSIRCNHTQDALIHNML